MIDGIVYNSSVGEEVAFVIGELKLTPDDALRLELITYEEWCQACEWLAERDLKEEAG